jgi:hypothetical protein
MDKQVFQIPATLSKCEALAHSTMKMTFHTQEGIDSDSMKRLFELYEKTGWLSFNVEKIEAKNIANLPQIDPKQYEGKSPSQRLRSVLYVLWQKKGSPGIFEDLYIKMMGRFQKQVSDEIEKYDGGGD